MVVAWIQAARLEQARKDAGDPGPVLARRLSNSEYNYTIRDLTGVDIRPAREFPVDPANPAGFDNSGESLAMSPPLLQKYLQAARSVADHMVLAPDGIAFAPHPALVETDRDKYVVTRIVDFYKRQPTDLAAYFRAAWQYKHRARRAATLTDVASAEHVSPKYLAVVWKALEEKKEDVGPLARVQAMWRKLPAGKDPSKLQEGTEQMRGFVLALRKKIEPRFAPLMVPGIGATAQPFLMWKNRQYATHRLSYDPGALQVAGEERVAVAEVPTRPRKSRADAADNNEEDDDPTPAPRTEKVDPDLQVPAGQRARYEAAFARFAAVFPDAFYISERGRNYLDPTKDKGRYLSAGFHNLMGYFRDDGPLYDLVLDAKGQADLDKLWQEMDFVAATTARTFTQFYLSETNGIRKAAKLASPPEGMINSEANIKAIGDAYLAKARPSGNKVALAAISEHFQTVNAAIRWAEKARREAEPRQLEAMQELAGRAYRRPLTAEEKADLTAYYRSLRDKNGLDHEDATRDLLVSVLMSPDFCYRIDLVDGGGARPVSDQALASRLSYFLWSSMPDSELLAHAAAGDLHRPEVLVAQARRMLKDDRAQGLATEFGGNWLDFRRFESHNAVDRERFPTFDNELRQAMFDEPIHFIDDVIRNDRSVLDFLYGRHTFVNAPLARHYGMADVKLAPGEWRLVSDARRYGRGGLLPMSVFLTQNAPGLRTSPVKRGYWVVRRVLGEQIPPPPAVVPELPHDEAKLDLPLRQLLARHREDPGCAGCHGRFDAFGLALEGYGPVGEVRSKDLAGRPVDAHAAFPGGTEGNGLTGLQAHIKAHRQDDFLDNLCRKLLAYSLGRSLQLSDEPTIQGMRTRLTARGQRFGALVEAVVTSPQFLTKRGPALALEKGN
jgi:hypothetical protein